MTKVDTENIDTDDNRKQNGNEFCPGQQYRYQLPEFYLQRAKEELNETPETVSERVDQLKSLLIGEKHLYCSTDTAHLLRFLRAKKFDVQRTFSMIKRYYQVKKDKPQLFGNLNPRNYSKFIEANIQLVLERRDNSGASVYLFRLQNCDMNVITADDIFRINLMTMELISTEPETQVSGVIIIIDMKSFSMKQHYSLLSPCYVKHSTEAVQESFPLRFRSFHVVNEPFYFQTLYAAIKPFLKPKMRKRIHFHGSKVEALHKYVSRDILPAEYGGSEPNHSKHWQGRFLSNGHVFQEIEAYGYDKKLESSRCNF